MKNKRKVYVYSTTRDYMDQNYLDLFSSMNAELLEGTEDTLNKFIQDNKEQQLDTETNVTEHYTARELYVIQLGTLSGDEQHIVDVTDMSKEVHEILKALFLSDEVTFLAHNAKFEYMVIYKHFEVCIKNFKDTFLASKLITAGLELPMGYNGLANLVLLRFGVDLSKAAQTSFTGEKMTPEQLLYADSDVLYLGRLLDALMEPIKKWGLVRCFNLENKALRPIGDMSINGILIDTDVLDSNIILYDQVAAATKQEMITAFQGEQNAAIQEKIKNMNIVQGNDEIIINWSSSVQKRKIIKLFYPNEEIQSTAKTFLTKLADTVDNPAVINNILSGNTEAVEMQLVSRHLQFLKDNEMFIAKGDLNMNFNSNAQLLEFFRLWYPSLANVGVKSLKKLKNPVIDAYKKYAKASKLVSSFGRKMYNYIEPDGRIHASFTQLVPTGSRMSSSLPNLQQAPATEQYRSMFIPKPGWKLIDSDYSSAEMFISAYLSGDKTLIYAIEQGYDLHGYSAYQIFGQGWIDAGGSATPVGKPPTKEASILRGKSKSLSFSLLYGTGVVAFSENSNISVSEGKALMERYYKTFPELAAFFKQSGEDALKFNYIREPHFNRVRFFNKPKNGMEASHNKNAGMNYKPQSINGSIMKYALCLMKKYIEEHKIEDKVRLLITVHDEQLSEAREDYAEEWAVIQTELMEKAAKFVIPSGVLKAESAILDHWTKG